jgi:hypothetical protein
MWEANQTHGDRIHSSAAGNRRENLHLVRAYFLVRWFSEACLRIFRFAVSAELDPRRHCKEPDVPPAGPAGL